MDVIDAYFDAVNREDWELMAGLWHADAALRTPSARPRHGVDDILAFYPKVLFGYAEHHDAIVRRIADGDTVVAEIHFEGRTHERQTIVFDAIDVFDLDGARIRALSTWYDSAEVAKQLAA